MDGMAQKPHGLLAIKGYAQQKAQAVVHSFTKPCPTVFSEFSSTGF